MPELSTLLLFAAGACVLVAVPGPNHMTVDVAYALALVALVSGRRQA